MSPRKSDKTPTSKKRTVKTTPAPAAAPEPPAKEAIQESPPTPAAEAAQAEKPAAPALNPKQELFCVELPRCNFNAAEAARRAGYAESAARQTGHDLLTNPDIQARVSSEVDRLRKEVQLDAASVLKQFMRLGFSDVRKIFGPGGGLRPITELDDDIAASIQSVKVVTRNLGKNEAGEMEVEYVHEIKMAEKKGPLENLARYLQLFAKDDEEQAKRSKQATEEAVGNYFADLVTAAKAKAAADANA
ncbi:MAG TPA: terminase small subunit [Pseudomonadales bacterium]